MPQEKEVDGWKNKLAGKLQQFFDKPTHDNYHFTLSSDYEGEQVSSPTTEDLQKNEKAFEAKDIFPSLRCFFRIYKSKIQHFN